MSGRGGLIFQANCFAERKPPQFSEQSFAAPFGLCRGFRQNPKWALKNFQLQPAKMLIALALLVPAKLE